MGDVKTDNDAAIAAALAQQEQEQADSALARRLNPTGSGPGSLPIVRGVDIGPAAPYPGSRRRVPVSNGPPFASRPATSRARPPPPSTSAAAPSRPNRPPPPLLPFGPPRQPHMCEVACVMGDHICVEMLVDSGAQTSVISSALSTELGLDSRIDRREVGVAAGVGRARIVGRIRGVVCTLGNVEFDMDFVVLEVPEKLLLLGLDQLRRFKCVIDLEREVLVFGGRDGVEVPMLPPSEQHVDWQNVIGNQCVIM